MNPFVSWEFLNALEESGSANATAGWLPTHAVLSQVAKGGNKNDDQATSSSSSSSVLGVCPLYVKGHSYGEYVFDHSWADAFQRMSGKSYYPKLQSCVPFSPVPGARLLARDCETRQDNLQILSNSLVSIADEMDQVSSLHVTFNAKEDKDYLSDQAGFL